MKNTSLCYIERGGQYLMLHRVKKENDENRDKWIGVGGKFEEGESPEDCVLREVKEETGLTLTRWRYCGIVTFVMGPWTEYMHLFCADGFEGTLRECDEGVLEWLDKKALRALPMWEGDHIFLDASTTAVFVAKALKEKERLTVITNSMEILLELSDVSGWNIISTGGVMKEGYLAFLGARTEESIRSYYVDKVIFSCKALDHEWGLMESKESFGTTKKAMIASGREKILVVDSTKFDQTAFSVAGKLRDVDVVVTDRKPSDKWMGYFEEANVKCLYPDMQP